MKENGSYRAHCLVLAFPAQGHINPMFQFSKRLTHKAVKITFVTTRFMINTIIRNSSSSSPFLNSNISFQTISDGFDEGGMNQAENLKVYMERFREVGSRTFTDLMESMNASSSELPLNCVVCNSFLPWGAEIAKEFGLSVALFFTQACAVDSVFYHYYKGILKVPLPKTKILLPGLPVLEPEDLPTFFCRPNPGSLEMLGGQFSIIDRVDWVLCNTVYELDPEVTNWMAEIWPLKTIGPTIPSKYLDKRLSDDTNYDLNMFRPTNDVCINWLNNRPKNSVIYISFGSIAAFDAEQMNELSWGIRQSGCDFLWVVRATEQEKLPKCFIEETKDKGLVVPWCSQLEVLSHEAIGCFVTHCGWNSTLEALSLGVPMVAIPHWSDQSTNAKYVRDVWGVGLKVVADEKGIARRESVEECIRGIMEAHKGKKIKENAIKWKILIKEAMEEGGSSDRAINDFVDGFV